MGLNRQQFEMALEQVRERLSSQVELQGTGFPQRIPLNLFETLPSTNQKLWELLDRGASAGTVVIAEQQTAGRGQWGRQWQSNLGGLYLSVALAPNIQASHSAQLTMCSAWGIAKALRSYGIPVFLKWPNDLLLKERKLGGILTETRVRHSQITRAVVGVGINWSNCVPESGINLQAFYGEELSLPVNSLEMLAAIVLQGLNAGYERRAEQGMESLLPSYLELLDSQGGHVLVNGNPGTITGVTPTGELRVCVNASNSTEAAVAGVAASASLTEICLKPGTISLGYRW